MADSGATQFCSACGGELPEEARFCANCGAPVAWRTSSAPQQAVQSETGREADDKEDNVGGKRSTATIAVILIGLLAVAAAVVAVLALTGSSGSSDIALIFEPGSDGFGDMYVVPLGQPYTHEDRILSDVKPTGGFSESLAVVGGIIRRGQLDFDVVGGRLIAYDEEGNDKVVLSVVDGFEVTVLVDGRGSLLVSRKLNGEVFAEFTDGERCTVYRIVGVDAVERLGRGTQCEVASSGAAMIVDHSPNETDVTVFSAAGVKLGFSHEEIDSRYRIELSPDGELVAYAIADGSSGDVSRVELLDTASESVVARLRMPPDAVLNGFKVLLDTGALVNVFDREIDAQVMYSLSSTGVEPVVVAAAISAYPSPDGAKVAIGARYGDDGAAEYQVWNAANRTLTDPTTVDVVAFNPFNPVGWVSDELAAVVSADGAIVGLEDGDQVTDLGSVNADVNTGSVRFRGGGLAYISTRGLETDTFSVAFASERTVTNVVAEGYRIRPLVTSEDGRYLALSVFEDSSLDEWLLYMYDFERAMLIEVDGGSTSDAPGWRAGSLQYIRFVGSRLIYDIQPSDEPDRVETRFFDPGASDLSGILYEGAVAILPTVGS